MKVLTEKSYKKIWLDYWRIRIKYHRFETIGFNNLDQSRSCLIVGYHGRPTAYDLCMMSVNMFEAWGYLPHGIIHRSYYEIPVLRDFFKGIGFVCGDGKEIENAVDRGEHIITAPGGAREGYRSFQTRYKVDWGKHLGYIRLAIKYDLPIIPVGATGVDDLFIGLNNGYEWGKKLGLPMGFPAWLAVGLTGVWPFTIPFPVKIRQIIGKPIYFKKHGITNPNDDKKLLAFHDKINKKVQELIDKQR